MSIEMILTATFCVARTEGVPEHEHVFCTCEHTTHSDGTQRESTGFAYSAGHRYYARMVAPTVASAYGPAVPTGWAYVQGVEWDSLLCDHCTRAGHRP